MSLLWISRLLSLVAIVIAANCVEVFHVRYVGGMLLLGLLCIWWPAHVNAMTIGRFLNGRLVDVESPVWLVGALGWVLFLAGLLSGTFIESWYDSLSSKP